MDEQRKWLLETDRLLARRPGRLPQRQPSFRISRELSWGSGRRCERAASTSEGSVGGIEMPSLSSAEKLA